MAAMTDTDWRPAASAGTPRSRPTASPTGRSLRRRRTATRSVSTRPRTEIETTPEHYNLIAGDPACADVDTRLRRPGRRRAAREAERATTASGACEILDAGRGRASRRRCSTATGSSSSATHSRPSSSSACRPRRDRALDEMLAVDPTCAAGGGAGGLPHRYSFGSSSASRHMMHVDEWVELIDLPTTTPILTAIFGSPNYIVHRRRRRRRHARRHRVPGPALRQHVVRAARPDRPHHDPRPAGARR